MPNSKSQIGVLVVFTVLVGAMAASDVAARERTIRFKSAEVRTSPQSVDDKREKLAVLNERGEEKHLVVQFSRPVSVELRKQLKNAGLELQAYLGDDAYVARRVGDAVDATLVVQSATLHAVRSFESVWKMHPMLVAGELPTWAVVASAEAPAQNVVGAYVMFHEDVSLGSTAVSLVQRHGGVVRDEVVSINSLVVELPFGRIAELAAEDGVLWVEPPLPKMEPVNDSNRELTGANIVQAAPYNLDGTGVRVLVFDAGLMSPTHPDFAGRILNPGDTSGVLDHATHVGGTVGGSGQASGGEFRGMAPNVDFITFGFQWTGDLFLYSNPGDVEADYITAQSEWGADISNNSIGTNTCWNGFPCSITGDYGITDSLIDKIVTGVFVEPLRVVWANGNERSCPFCPGEHQNGYHSTAPPACAKNHLTVGALNSNDDSMTDFSSWGPCDDGRLKPDVAAPGCQSNDDQGVTSCSPFGGGYFTICGTSMASPTVCGLGAILLEDFRNHYPDRPDFRNSTLRAMLAHTADDWGADQGMVGPDYRTGYGSVRIQPAVDFLRSGNFLEAEINQDGTYSVLVIVNPGDPFMKVTIAWDDPFAAPLVQGALINDLDLVVLDPSGEQRHVWTLNPANPGAPAVQTQADHVNNIEQVFVANPEPGVWRVEVHGTSVAQGPQTFSLCGSPSVVNCSTRGVVAMDKAKYACGNSAVIQVVDCDLNTDDNVVETITVQVASTLEPSGETLTLIETGGATALFRANIALNSVDEPGVLLVGDGVSVTAKYIDADDGFGGINVEMLDNALLDCVAANVQDVQTTNILPYDATVSFTTNESARCMVRIGLSCDALNGLAEEEDFATTHAITVSQLNEDTTYFYAILCLDTVGNESTFNANGACYAFGTADIPNFFTQEINGVNDLQFTLLDFTPDESVDRYIGCATAIASLPTDPIGGTVLTLPNDGFVQVNIADGHTVQLYGVEYGSFYVGSNGYVTFTAGDNDGNESLNDHFDTPRVSALFDNLNPSTGGQVSWMQLPNRMVVTWENVPKQGQTGVNTFQIEMYFDGRITIGYLGISANDGIVGLSDGMGLSEYFAPADLSSFDVCGPRPPRAQRVNAFTVVDAPVTIALAATDDGLPTPPGQLTYVITQLPVEGALAEVGGAAIDAVPHVLSANEHQVVYTPNAGDTGPDNFRFAARDGGAPPEGGESAPASVLLQVDVDCNANGIGDPFDLDGGASLDCNVNAIPDECDIAGGASNDCEPDGVPDECQVDCNNNGITDTCDIGSGASADCNGNVVPDECDLAGWAMNFFPVTFDPPQPISPGGLTSNVVAVSSEGEVTKVDVEVTINHTRIGDLWIALRHNGVTCVLVDRCGGDGDNFTQTRFDDEAITPICEGTAPFFGTYQPHQSLSVLDGLPVAGDWTLLVRDTTPGVTGTWSSWVLHVPVGSPDCNENLVPDECEDDCNANELPDDCDVATGRSLDDNADMVPDECQCLSLRGDVNLDTRIDLRDFGGLSNCFGQQTGFACACADIDVDASVDLHDAAMFVPLLAGP